MGIDTPLQHTQVYLGVTIKIGLS